MKQGTRHGAASRRRERNKRAHVWPSTNGRSLQRPPVCGVLVAWRSVGGQCVARGGLRGVRRVCVARLASVWPCGVRVARSLRCCTCGVCASVSRLARAPHGAKICVLETSRRLKILATCAACAAFNSSAYLLAACPWLVPHFAAYWMHTAARCFLLPLFVTDGGGLLLYEIFFLRSRWLVSQIYKHLQTPWRL